MSQRHMVGAEGDTLMVTMEGRKYFYEWHGGRWINVPGTDGVFVAPDAHLATFDDSPEWEGDDAPWE